MNFEDDWPYYDHIGGPKYQVMQMVGKGMNSEVHEVVETTLLGRHLAMKYISFPWKDMTLPLYEEERSNRIKRFQKEAKAWMRIEADSPNVVKLVDVISHRIRARVYG